MLQLMHCEPLSLCIQWSVICWWLRKRPIRRCKARHFNLLFSALYHPCLLSLSAFLFLFFKATNVFTLWGHWVWGFVKAVPFLTSELCCVHSQSVLRRKPAVLCHSCKGLGWGVSCNKHNRSHCVTSSWTCSCCAHVSVDPWKTWLAAAAWHGLWRSRSSWRSLRQLSPLDAAETAVLRHNIPKPHY